MCFNHILFFAIAFNLSCLIKQRISVPELKTEKGKYFVLIFSLLSITFSILVLLFFNKTSIFSTKTYLKLTDNIFFLAYIFSCYIFSVDTYYFLNRIEVSNIPKEGYYLNLKKYLITIMGIALFQYFFCLLLVSFYNPVIYIERLLTSSLIVLKEINSVLFLVCFLMYFATLKYDFFYFFIALNTRPDLEFFVEEKDEECVKFLK